MEFVDVKVKQKTVPKYELESELTNSNEIYEFQLSGTIFKFLKLMVYVITYITYIYIR